MHGRNPRPGLALEQHGTDVARASDTRGANQGGPAFHPGNKLAEIVRGYALSGDDQLVRAWETCDRLEVVQQIVPQRVNLTFDDMRAPIAHTESVSIGRRVDRTADADAAASTSDVLNDDRLAEAFAHRPCNGPSDRVRWPTGGKRDDERDPMRGVFCRNGG